MWIRACIKASFNDESDPAERWRTSTRTAARNGQGGGQPGWRCDHRLFEQHQQLPIHAAAAESIRFSFFPCCLLLLPSPCRPQSKFIHATQHPKKWLLSSCVTNNIFRHPALVLLWPPANITALKMFACRSTSAKRICLLFFSGRHISFKPSKRTFPLFVAFPTALNCAVSAKLAEVD